MLSDRAHVIFPWHIAEDRVLSESTADGEGLGTTLRGIGPVIATRLGRSFGVRWGPVSRHLSRPDSPHRPGQAPDASSLDGEDDFERWTRRDLQRVHAVPAERLRPYVADTTAYPDAAEKGRRILFEGAQGCLLHVDHGT